MNGSFRKFSINIFLIWAPIGIESQVVHFGKYLIKNSPPAHNKREGGNFCIWESSQYKWKEVGIITWCENRSLEHFYLISTSLEFFQVRFYTPPVGQPVIAPWGFQGIFLVRLSFSRRQSSPKENSKCIHLLWP